MGIIILFFRKPDFLQVLVHILKFNWNELIWLDRRLNWDPGNIFRLVCKPKSLQTCRNLFGNTRNHYQKSQSQICWKPIFLENSFFKSRPHMAAQADPQSGKCSYIDLLSFILSAKTWFRRSNKWLLPGVLMSTPVSHKNTLFHLEPSGIYFL